MLDYLAQLRGGTDTRVRASLAERFDAIRFRWAATHAAANYSYVRFHLPRRQSADVRSAGFHRHG
jgi:hypothetical protein